jgi:hypothetical protein
VEKAQEKKDGCGAKGEEQPAVAIHSGLIHDVTKEGWTEQTAEKSEEKTGCRSEASGLRSCGFSQDDQ